MASTKCCLQNVGLVVYNEGQTLVNRVAFRHRLALTTSVSLYSRRLVIAVTTSPNTLVRRVLLPIDRGTFCNVPHYVGATPHALLALGFSLQRSCVYADATTLRSNGAARSVIYLSSNTG